VVANLSNILRNSIQQDQLPLLASRLPTALEPCMDILGLDSALLGPVREFVSRDSKQVRGQMVRIGFSLSNDDLKSALPKQDSLLDCLACVVEALHAGSLMIDDIQDAAEMRRGKTALHTQIGVPLAINAANWLYFWPSDLLRQQSLSPTMELEIYRLFHRTMMRAHQGQALDLGHDMTKTSQLEALEISAAAIELKTGELMAMCAEFGAIVGEADSVRRSHIAKFGRRFGVALQMLNDIGEVTSKSSSPKPIGSLNRPSWVWTLAAKDLRPDEFFQFQSMMCRPHEGFDGAPLASHRIVVKAGQQAMEEFENVMEEIQSVVKNGSHLATISWLRELAQKVMIAYG
jgi:geranylgeranyl pyrophosphate synthase